MEERDKHALMFAQLVLMFHAGAMQHLGKVKNPLTDTIERDLTAAQGMIDLLEMLKVRTKGNLAPEETRMLDQVLQELRLNYVDEAAKPEPPNAEPVNPEPTKPDPAKPDPAKPDPQEQKKEGTPS
ncbi:MAG TPA: DUF1844 domain-containing protein [Bacteroidota bacterium]|nr:DUF1844 domain-containing protein [Bacteroidota bacterium]